MKKLFIQLFALIFGLFLSVNCIWAADPVVGSSTEASEGSFTNGYDYSFSTSGTSVTISFTEKENYTGLVAYLWNYTSGFAETQMTVSGHTASITLPNQTPGSTLTFACKFAYSGGMSVTKKFDYTIPSGGGQPGGDTPATTPASCTLNGAGKGSYSSITYSAEFENDDKGVVILTFTTSEALTGYANPAFYDENNNSKSATTSDGKVYTLSLSGKQDDDVVKLRAYIPMSGGVYQTELMSYTVGTFCTAPGGDEPDCPEFTASTNAVNAYQSADGNLGTRWWSDNAEGDGAYWEHTYATAQTFNRVKIVWEGAWGKSFDILAGEDCEHLTTIAEVRDQSLSNFPYTQVIELAETITAKTIRFQGVKKATGYGYSFWELEVYEQQTPVLTTFEFSASATLCKKGETVTLTATPKDQFGVVMTGQTITYEVSPSIAGHVTDGKYYADAFGEAIITATCGSINKQVTIFNYEGANLAESTNVSTNNKIVSHSNQGQDGYVAGSAKDAYYAVDNSDNTLWEGKMGGNTGDDEASRTYDSWFIVDLGANYDINCVLIKFEGACSQNYTLDFSADNESWVNGYTYSGNYGTNGHTDKIYEGSSQNLQNNDNVRYVRFWSTKAATQYNMKIYYFKVFGTEAATTTKNVSATVNDAAMGSAVVKQNNVVVTQVEVGTNADFIATENDGYLFTGWYQGDTKLSSDKTYTVENIQANTTLQARFRKLDNIYCHTQLTSGDKSIYLTMKRTAENTYQVVIDSETEMKGFTNAFIGGINGDSQIKLNDADVMAQYVTLSADKHRLTINVTSTTPIKWNTPIYINMPGEVAFNDPQNKVVEYEVECEDVAVESVTVSPSSATIDVEGNTTLVAVASPVYAEAKTITWSTSDETTAIVVDGLVTGIEEGTATITASIGGKSANCSITVQLDPTVPHVAAPTVVSTGKEIRSVYSDALTSALTSEFSLNTYGTAPCEKKVVAGDNLILCSATTGNVIVTWGREANVAGAFIAKPGMNDGINTGLDASGMAYLHIDLWSSAAASNVNIQNDNTVIASVNLDGSGWQSFDIDVTSMASTLNNIFIMKYANLPINTKVAIDNVYFWKSTGTAAIESVSLNKSTLTLDAGDKETLVASVAPLAASQNVTWETSNEAIATVINGVVTAIAAGEAVITAKSEADPTKLATCSLTVETPTDKVWYGNAEQNGVLFEYKLTYKTDKHVLVETKIYTNVSGLNDRSFSIDGEWKNLAQDGDVWSRTTDKTFVKGTEVECYFRAAYEAGGVSNPHFNYVVGSENTKPAVPVTGIQVNKQALTLAIDETETLTATVLPMNADNKNYSWSSDNESVATVDATGLVTAHAEGNANIIATSEDGGKKDTCVLTVAAALTPATFYINGADKGNMVTIRMAITRNIDRTLTYQIKAYHNKEGFTVQVNDGAYNTATLNEGVYSWSSTTTYVDGANVDGFIYMPYSGNAARVDFKYVVGSENEYANPMLSLLETASNEDTLALYNTQEIDATINRSFTAGSVYTLCLPFAADAAQCEEALGAGYKLEKLGDAYMKSSDMMYLPFSQVASMEAGVPYLYTPTVTQSTLTFEGVVIDKDANKPIGNSLCTMTGFVNPTVIPTNEAYYLGNDQYLHLNTSTSATYAFRAYFNLNFPAGTPVSARARIAITDTATDLENANVYVNANRKVMKEGRLIIIREGKMYDAQGQLVK